MNKAQALHAKSIARHIREHANKIVITMASIESTNLSDVPLDIIEGHFGELEYHWNSIQQVLEDMLPELERQ